jgi:outer membrane protein OmpA-like peptidoglycan-associated protein
VARSEAVTRDADADGVIDDEDLCPTQAGAGKADGCPDVRRIIVESSGDMVVLQQVRFASGRADIPKPSQPILDEVARLLAGNPDIKLVAIEGHADGHERQPDQLSAKRADAAVAYLVKKGVDPKRLLPEHAGSAKPIAPNDTPDNREKNRRIEFHVR